MGEKLPRILPEVATSTSLLGAVLHYTHILFQKKLYIFPIPIKFIISAPQSTWRQKLLDFSMLVLLGLKEYKIQS